MLASVSVYLTNSLVAGDVHLHISCTIHAENLCMSLILLWSGENPEEL